MQVPVEQCLRLGETRHLEQLLTQHLPFRQSLGIPAEVLAQLDQPAWYMSSEDYARWAVQMFKAERSTIERVGLLAK